MRVPMLQGGWADRLYKLLAGPQLVLAQDLPARLWYEAALRPYEHYVPLDAAFANLSEAVAWAREHDGAAQAIVLAANRAVTQWTSTQAMHAYVGALLRGAARKVRPRDVQEEVGDPRPEALQQHHGDIESVLERSRAPR